MEIDRRAATSTIASGGMPVTITPAADHNLLPHLRPAVSMLLLFTVLTGLIYPLAVTGLAQVVLRPQANGSLVAEKGKVVGSQLIGQLFASDRYFHGRPSATSAADPNDPSKTIDMPYNAANSSGSNLGPISKALFTRVKADSEKLKAETGTTVIPADAVTTSASGLDPDISPAYARLQVTRVAKARQLPEEKVRQLLDIHIEQPLLGVLGEPHVNVLRLNMDLDSLQG